MGSAPAAAALVTCVTQSSHPGFELRSYGDGSLD